MNTEKPDAAPRCTEQQLVGLLRQACEIYRDASYQSHTGHWDSTMQHGAGCPECIRARKLRAKADAIMEQANAHGDISAASADKVRRVVGTLNQKGGEA